MTGRTFVGKRKKSSITIFFSVPQYFLIDIALVYGYPGINVSLLLKEFIVVISGFMI
jgi:hypothetical protein